MLERTFPITQLHTDAFGICRADALMELMQEVAGEHSELLGIDRSVMVERHNCVWMLVRSFYTLERDLLLGQNLTICTFPCHNDATSSERYFAFSVDGEQVGWALQLWVLVDQDQRKIAVMRKFPEIQAMQMEQKPVDFRLRHFPLPQMENACTYTVGEADIDINGHMNNARYLRPALQPLACSHARSVQIHYNKECLCGQTLQLQMGQQDGESYTVGLLEDGTSCFEAKIR